jgi:hypothetical protein
VVSHGSDFRLVVCGYPLSRYPKPCSAPWNTWLPVAEIPVFGGVRGQFSVHDDDSPARAVHLSPGVKPVLLFQNDASVPNQLDRHSARALGAMAKRAMRMLRSWTAVLVVSTALAYAFGNAMVAASTNSGVPAQAIVVSGGLTSHSLASDMRYDILESCLTAWRHVPAHTNIDAAGLEQFIESGCGAPW